MKVSDANRAVDKIVRSLQVKKFIKLLGESYHCWRCKNTRKEIQEEHFISQRSSRQALLVMGRQCQETLIWI